MAKPFRLRRRLTRRAGERPVYAGAHGGTSANANANLRANARARLCSPFRGAFPLPWQRGHGHASRPARVPQGVTNFGAPSFPLLNLFFLLVTVFVCISPIRFIIFFVHFFQHISTKKHSP
jgi:hypothetical protein